MSERKKVHMIACAEGRVLCERRKNYFRVGNLATTKMIDQVTCRFCLQDLRRKVRKPKPQRVAVAHPHFITRKAPAPIPAHMAEASYNE